MYSFLVCERVCVSVEQIEGSLGDWDSPVGVTPATLWGAVGTLTAGGGGYEYPDAMDGEGGYKPRGHGLLGCCQWNDSNSSAAWSTSSAGTQLGA